MGQYQNETQTGRINSKLGAQMFTMNGHRLYFSIENKIALVYNQFIYKVFHLFLKARLIHLTTAKRPDHYELIIKNLTMISLM